MKLDQSNIDELYIELSEAEKEKNPHKVLELKNEIGRRQECGEQPSIDLDSLNVAKICIKEKLQEIGVILSTVIIITLVVSIYLFTAAETLKTKVLFGGSLALSIGLIATLCYYIRHKSIVLRTFHIIFLLFFSWTYITGIGFLGLGDEVSMLIAVLSFIAGIGLISVGLILTLSPTVF